MHRPSRQTASTLSLGVLLACALGSSTVSADPTLRTQLDLRGNFVLFGATLAHECAAGVPVPLLGTIGSCPDDNVAAPDIYWRADDPSAGAARADADISAADARATSVLVLPDGAEVAYARLYWGGLLPSNSPDMQIQLQRVEGAVDQAVMADDTISLAQTGTTAFFYQSTADVTELVKTHGPGAYRIAGVNSSLTNGATGAVAAWYMVVFYELAGEPSRNLAIFDGLEYVDGSTQANATLSGFVVPAVGFDAALGVVAYEGETQFTGDALSFNGMTLTNASNPADNFFNATRSRFGMAVANMGDLPRLSGAPGSYSNVDMDVIDVTARVSGGDTSATIAASSTLDIYVLSAFVTSVSTLLPDFTPTTKEVVDVNGGVAAPGDVLEYRIVARNQGSDTGVNVRLRDALPLGVSFVPGSLRVEAGANMGAKTDAAADDQAEYDAASRTVTARLGMGASGTAGGELAIGASSELRFQVTVDADTRGEVKNQGFVLAAGEQGAVEVETATDADATVDGQGETTITVEECEDDMQCEAPTPFCDISRSPRECVGCVNGMQCEDPAIPDCDLMTHTCVCASGPNTCVDMDMDDISDGAEDMLGTDPMDADTDDDGLIDGHELAPEQDTDADGVINALDPDSDNDGLSDGLELGLPCNHVGTELAAGHCRPDADNGATVTSPVKADTDDGGVRDGSEDFDLDGAIDMGETDPTEGHGADDVTVPDRDVDKLSDPLEDTINSDPVDPDTDDGGVRDGSEDVSRNGLRDGGETDPTQGQGADDTTHTDGDSDGLSDALEMAIGSNPGDADSDDDGLTDGEEANPTDDHDRDGMINAVDSDSDADMLFDGTELGKGCDNPATDNSRMQCRPDADMGATVTSPVNGDTDYGGILDGKEDRNTDGVVTPGETNPNDEVDDAECELDADCGDMVSGQVCIDGACAPGCRGADGNLCPDGERCTSVDGNPGTCEPLMTPVFGGGGCKCGVSTGLFDPDALPTGLLVVWSVLFATRRRRDGH